MHFKSTHRFAPRSLAPAPVVSLVGVFTVALLVALTGCQVAHVTQSVPQKLFANDMDSQMEFWHTLAGDKLASNDEAFHAILLYVDSQDSAKNYEERVKLLKSRKMLPPDFNRAGDEVITRGTLAVPIVRALQIKGGLMMRLAGSSPRYAVRELQYAGLYPTSSPNQVFTGTELVGIIGKLDDYQNGVPPPVTGRLAGQ